MTWRAVAATAAIMVLALSGCLSGNEDAQRDLEARISNVETGVPPAVIVKGQTPDMFSITEMMTKLNVPGVSVAVIDKGRIAWAECYGVKEVGGEPLTANTIFQAGSVSKPVVAMAALSLVAEGTLDLDMDVKRYLRSWQVPENEFTSEAKVTLRRLLSHTAGVSSAVADDGGPPGEAPTLLQILNGEEPAKGGPVSVDLVPGSQQRYSNEGYAIVQQLLIDVEGKPFPQIMKEHVLEPLKMDHSTFAQPLPVSLLPVAATGHIGAGVPIDGKGLIYHNMGAGGLWTTPSDLAKFAMEIQGSITGGADGVLSMDMASAMLSDPVCGYGLGLGATGEGPDRTFGHSGHNAGFLCHMKALAEGGQGVVVMANSNKAIPLLEGITFAVAREFQWPGEIAPRQIEPFDLTEDELSAYCGQYAIGDYVVTIGMDNGRLTISHFEGEDTLIPASDTLFLQQLDGIELTFVKDDQDQIEAISLMDGRLTLTRIE
jgi:CubicO group peptidase (beta-lactamase class C family)